MRSKKSPFSIAMMKHQFFFSGKRCSRLVIFNQMKEPNLIPVRCVDDNSRSKNTYPFNPNGSPDGVAALCSQDGRHLAIMPHPERCFLPWLCPWLPWEMRGQWDASPWFKMFQNANDWSMGQMHSKGQVE